MNIYLSNVLKHILRYLYFTWINPFYAFYSTKLNLKLQIHIINK